jgi:hypothetical protein
MMLQAVGLNPVTLQRSVRLGDDTQPRFDAAKGNGTSEVYDGTNVGIAGGEVKRQNGTAVHAVVPGPMSRMGGCHDGI